MRVYVCYRSGHDYSNEPFAVCSTLEIARKECVDEILKYNKNITIDNLNIGEIKDGWAVDINLLTIVENPNICGWHEFEIWETEVK